MFGAIGRLVTLLSGRQAKQTRIDPGHVAAVPPNVLINGDLTLEQYLASIGITGHYEVWAEVEVDDNSDASMQAEIDAFLAGMDPEPNKPLNMLDTVKTGMYLDDMGRAKVYTIVCHDETHGGTPGQIIGDAIWLQDQNRWLFEYDIDFMGALAN